MELNQLMWIEFLQLNLDLFVRVVPEKGFQDRTVIWLEGSMGHFDSVCKASR